MNASLLSVTAILIGGGVGWLFGSLQQAAARRNERRQAEGNLKNGWAVMPGSFARVAYLLVGLAVVQFLCPLLFAGTRQWWVSAGLGGGYGWTLLRQLLRRTGRLAA